MKRELKNTSRLIIILLIIAGFCSCGEKNKKPEDLGFISLGEAKDYLYFKTGTWWVYKNSLTSEIETLTMVACDIDTFHAASDKRIFDYEDIGFYLKGSRDNATYFTYSPGMTADDLDYYVGWLWECKREEGFYNNYYTGSGLSCQFYYPFDKERGRGNGVYSTKFIEKIDSLTVKGKTYFDVVSFSAFSDNSYPYPNMEFGKHGNSTYFWAKNVGLIKIDVQGYDINNNRLNMTWELTELHIIK